MKTAGIIGGADFIGRSITQKFLTKGYNARVSVGDLAKKHRYDHLAHLENAVYHPDIVAIDGQD